MKRVFIPVLFLIGLSIVSFIKPNEEILEYNDALKIGINRYLKFLWMVDGAFNNERYNEEYVVNGNKMSDDDKIFTCKYKNRKRKECVGENFEQEFENLFSKNINYESVYGDQAIYSWVTYDKGKYIFKNLNSCNIDRMGINHHIEVTNIKSDVITYEVSFEGRQSGKVNKRKFILNLENNEWKIRRAFYHDLCGMRYVVY